MKTGDECWLTDGRKAFYAGAIDGQEFVRVAVQEHSSEYGFEEWPSDALTPVSKILISEPSDVYGPQVLAQKDELGRLSAECTALREEARIARQEIDKISASAEEVPDVSTVLDFAAGRITHVVEITNYGALRIHELSEFLRGDEGWRCASLRLISLFGEDVSGKTSWRRNHYYDGSGSWTQFEPCVGIDAAQSAVTRMFDEMVEAYRAGEVSSGKPGGLSQIESTCALHDFLSMPELISAAIASRAATVRREKIEKLTQQLSELEAEQ